MAANGLSPLRKNTSRRIASGGLLRLVEHDAGGRLQPLRFVVRKRRNRIGRRKQGRRQRARIEDRLAAPLEPRGTIGCAASPSSVTRPKVQRGSGSWSTIGNSSTLSAARIKAGTSSQSKCQSANAAE